jgi:signal transduction histidine kinase
MMSLFGTGSISARHRGGAVTSATALPVPTAMVAAPVVKPTAGAAVAVPPDRRRQLPRLAWGYLGVVVIAGVGAVGLAIETLTSPRAAALPSDVTGALLIVGLMVAAIVAQHAPLTLGPRHKYTLAMPVAFAAVLLWEPALAVVVVGLSQLLGQGTLALRRDGTTGRRRRGLPAVVFNTAQTVLATGLGGLVYVALRPPAPALLVPAGAAGLAAAAGGAAVMFVVNTVAVAMMVALQRGKRPWTVWLTARRADHMEAAGDYLLGFLVAWALPREPWLLIPLAAGAVVVYRALARRTALLQREREVARQDADATALRELHRLKDEFLGTITHELRNPLTVVCGFAELLQARAERLDPADRNMLAHLATGAERLSRMVDDLLDFTRLQRGVLNVHPTPIDVVPVLEEVLAGLRVQPGGDRLVAELPETLPAIADHGRVAQAAINLLVNALKYAPEGPVTLRAGAYPGAGPEQPGVVRIDVEDHGPGIPEAEQGRVWEQFYRGVAAAGAAPGTGIGLAVVKALTEAQGGRVGLWSVPGQGSRFWLELPTTSVPGRRAATLAPASPGADAGHPV